MNALGKNDKLPRLAWNFGGVRTIRPTHFASGCGALLQTRLTLRFQLTKLTQLTQSTVLATLFLSFQAAADTVANSKHNLTVNGPGSVKASTETDTCLFCHTVHRTTGQTPLWSHGMSSVSNYVVYSSPTLKATVGQPDGSSRLCLSCHDGTVALGMVSSRTTTIQMQQGVTTLPTGPSNLGTDLSGDHPISFVYDQNLSTLDSNVKDPSTLDKRLKLDHSQKLQCVTCHNPHDDQFGNFLVMPNTGSALCLGCHLEPGWGGSAHGTSPVKLTQNPTPLVHTALTATTVKAAVQSVAANGCQNCHVSHKAGSKARLLIHSREEQNCFTCHDGRVTQKDLRPEFNKPSAHPILQTSTLHTLAEDPVNGPRHTACSDCHNSHAASVTATALPKTKTSLAGVKGLNSVGVIINPATHDYEICFRCHAESVNRGPARVTRQFPETNKRLQFRATNRSFHPLEATGRNPNVPSLISPWTTSSLMTCTDCHNSDQGTRSGGSGPDGPHGSAFTPILERRLILTDGNVETEASYALCYKCHSRDSILSDQSFRAFNGRGEPRGHKYHIVDQKTACTTCHDSHGVAENTKSLINFNLSYVQPLNRALMNSGSITNCTVTDAHMMHTNVSGLLEYRSTGTFSGTCTLCCHNFPHYQFSYPAMLPQTPLRRSR